MEPATAWAASSFRRRARPRSERSWLSRTTGTTSPRSVSQAKPMWTAGLAVEGAVHERGIEIGRFQQRPHGAKDH